MKPTAALYLNAFCERVSFVSIGKVGTRKHLSVRKDLKKMIARSVQWVIERGMYENASSSRLMFGIGSSVVNNLAQKRSRECLFIDVWILLHMLYKY